MIALKFTITGVDCREVRLPTHPESDQQVYEALRTALNIPEDDDMHIYTESGDIVKTTELTQFRVDLQNQVFKVCILNKN